MPQVILSNHVLFSLQIYSNSEWVMANPQWVRGSDRSCAAAGIVPALVLVYKPIDPQYCVERPCQVRFGGGGSLPFNM